jgi:uncharacterized membrane protein YtjA (UPF0391 family)
MGRILGGLSPGGKDRFDGSLMVDRITVENGNFRSNSGLFQHRAWRRTSRQNQKTEVFAMLSWVVTFLVVALIAGILGFGGIAGASIEIAKAIFFIAIILFLISAVVGLVRGRTRV